MKVAYDPSFSCRNYLHYYQAQAGHGLRVFRGARIQAGHGLLGSIVGGLKSFAKAAVPYAKRAGRSLLRTGLRIGSDAINGVPIGESIKHQATEEGRSLLRGLSDKLDGNSNSRGATKRKRPSSSGKPKRGGKRRRLNGATIFE